MTRRSFIITTQLLLILSMTKTQAQENTSGIHFEQGLKWSKVIAKAKAENKYVFIDCYATWCGPCKLMEQTVYPQKAVGDIYNKGFVCVKVQMDQTAGDNDQVKSWYKTAKMLETDYHVNAYPTYLFFDSVGNPVHKVTGSMAENAFIQLAEDAQNPDKQYYAILKNFQPGKLDTADEKGLAYAFAYSDKELAGRIAGDYLSRVPTNQLNQSDKAKLMVMFQNNPQVLNLAISVIKSYGKVGFAQNGHGNFISAMAKQKPVMDIALTYIKCLSQQEMAQPDNLRFMMRFLDNRDVKQIAKRFIEQLSDKDRYNKPMLFFIAIFTDTPQDNGFRFYYNNADQIDSAMQNKHFAENEITYWISNEEWQPVLESAKQSTVTPDFDQLEKSIAKKYDTRYGQQIKLQAVIDWYSYLVHQKKLDAYWPQLVKALLDKDRPYMTDKTAVPAIDVNNDCWAAYLHTEDTNDLSLALSLITKMLEYKPNDVNTLDTYAAVLYKSGKTQQAITTEERALAALDTIKHPVIAAGYRKKIEAMKRNEKIWLDPAFQN